MSVVPVTTKPIELERRWRHMEREIINRAEAIRERLTQLRDSL